MDRPRVVIDVTEKCLKHRDYQMTVEDINLWEKENKEIPERAVVLIRTGWGNFWPNKENYFGTAGSDPSFAHFPSEKNFQNCQKN